MLATILATLPGVTVTVLKKPFSRGRLKVQEDLDDQRPDGLTVLHMDGLYIIALWTVRRSSEVVRHHECHELSAMTESYQASKQPYSYYCVTLHAVEHRIIYVEGILLYNALLSIWFGSNPLIYFGTSV